MNEHKHHHCFIELGGIKSSVKVLSFQSLQRLLDLTETHWKSMKNYSFAPEHQIFQNLLPILFYSCFIGLPQFTASPLCGSLFPLCCVSAHLWGTGVRILPCTLSSPAAKGNGAELCSVCWDQKSTMNESSSARARESTWSSGQQMKMENCYHLWVPFKYMQAGRGDQVMMDAPCPRRCWYDQRNTWAPTPSSLPLSRPPHFTAVIDKQMCVGHPQAQKIVRVPLGWEILFICCTSPIMFLSPSGLWVLFIKIAGILTYFSAQKLNNNNNNKKAAFQHTCIYTGLPRKRRYGNAKYKLVFSTI